MNRLAVDDHVTIVAPTLTLCLVVESVARNTFTCLADNFLLPDAGGWAFNNDEEGILWLRGWHTPDSEEVKAARVAQGIGDQKRVKRPTYKELEQRLQQANSEVSNARKLLHEMKRKAEAQRHPSVGGYPWCVDPQINPHGNESYSDAAWRRKLRGY